MRLLRSISVLVLLLSLGSCSSYQTMYDYDTKADFTKYETFDIAGMTSEDPRVSQLIEQRIDRAIREELRKKGLEPQDENAELEVKYHVATEEKIDVRDYGYRYWRFGWAGGPDVFEYVEGELIVDLVDAEKEQLIWRGSTQGTLTSGKPAAITRKINNAMEDMFKNYPPKGARQPEA